MRVSLRAIACREKLGAALLLCAASAPVYSTEHEICRPRTSEVHERCNDALEATTPRNQEVATLAKLSLDTPLSTLEAVAPYCGELALWLLVGANLEAGEAHVALKWYELARSRTLLHRLVSPRDFLGGSRRTIKALDAAFSREFADFLDEEPAVEKQALRGAIAWDRVNPSLVFPPRCYPGLYAEVRSRLSRKLRNLDAVLP